MSSIYKGIYGFFVKRDKDPSGNGELYLRAIPDSEDRDGFGVCWSTRRFAQRFASDKDAKAYAKRKGAKVVSGEPQ